MFPVLQEDDRVITQLLETIDDLMKQSPDLFREQPVKPEKSLMTPTPPRRNRVRFDFQIAYLYLKLIDLNLFFLFFSIL